jgi:hypothetical protein
LNFGNRRQAYARCGIGETALAILGRDEGSHAILPSGRIGGVAFERVLQRPHLAAAQIEVKEQVELAISGLVSPHDSRRLLKSFRRPTRRVAAGWSSPISSLA